MRYRESLPVTPWVRVRETAERVREKCELIAQDDDECSPVTIGVMLDLDDAATVGCLEARLLESWPGARISIKVDPWADAGPLAEIVIRTKFGAPPRSFVARGPRARVEAIIAALEAAPKTGGAS